MTSLEASIKNTVLPVALANAALLITAPSLGCLTTDARVLNDLCQVYSLSSPDLTQVLQYSKEIMMPSSISLERSHEDRKQKLSEENQALGYNQYNKPTKEISFSTSENLNERWEATRGAMDTGKPVCRIRKECENPMLERIKKEVENYTDMYLACRKPPQTEQDDTDKFRVQPANLNSGIRHKDKYCNQNDSQKLQVKPANQNDEVTSADQPANQNNKVRSRVESVNHNDPGQSELHTSISLVSPDQQSNNVGTVMKTSNEKQSVPTTTNNDKTPAQRKHGKIYSYLLPDGNLIEEVDMINHDIMPVKYWGFNKSPKDAVLKVLTYVKKSKKSPWLYITIRKKQNLPISFWDIRGIHSNGHDCIMIYFSSIVHRIQCEASITKTGKVRSAVQNKKALLVWLNSVFLQLN